MIARRASVFAIFVLVVAACSSPSGAPSSGGTAGDDAGAGGDAEMATDGQVATDGASREASSDAAPRDASSDAASCGATPSDAGSNGGCGCTGNPGTVSSDATGPCIRYAAPTGMLPGTQVPACAMASCDVVYRFDRAYGCGQFANGDYFVVPPGGGKVLVTAIEPATVANGGTLRHGFDVNPAAKGTSPQHWDSRVGAVAPPPALPYAASPGESIVKYVSAHPDWTDTQGGGFDDDCTDNTVDSKSCGQFAAVLTVLDAAPPCPGTTFRPPYVGTYKPLLSTAGLRTQILSRLPGSCCTDRIDLATATAWTRYLRLDYTDDSIFCDNTPPMDAEPQAASWSTDIWHYDTSLVAWLNMADVCASPPCSATADLAAKTPVLIGYVQHGIDIWGMDHLGIDLFRGGGGNGGGKLFAYAFAAAMLDDAQVDAAIGAVDPTHFFETSSFYRGQNGVALWGQPAALVGATEADYWSDLASPPGQTKTIRDPYGWIDGGGSPGGAYQDNTAKPTQYSALLMRLMPAFGAAWPSNASVILDYADRWVSHGAHTLPDPCAPVQGTYGVDYGPDGKGGCIQGSGRVPALDGANQNGGNRDDPFGDEMWTAFRDCSATCSCPGQSCVH